MPDYGDDRGFGPSKSSNNFGGGNKNSQTHNSQGTAYSGKLADFMADRNSPGYGQNVVDNISQSIVQERGGYINRSVSPEDLAAAAGLMAQANQFGPNNNDVQTAMANAYSRAPGGSEQRGVLGSYNLGMGINPTTGMGFMDSIKYNTIDQPEFMDAFKPKNIFGGLLGAATGIPFAGLALGGLFDQKEKRDKNIKMAKLEGIDG